MKKNIIKTIKNIDKIIFLCTILLSIYSIILIYSSSNQNISIILKKILHIIISILIMFFLSKLNINFYKKNANLFYIILNILLLFVIIKGHIIKGAQRWIDLKIIKFQPSEISKIIVILLIANKISNNYPLKFIDIIYCIIVTIIPTILTYLQPDLGTSLLIIISGLITLFLGGINKKNIFILTILTIFMIPISWKFLLHEYQKKRIITLINHKDKFNKNYHINQSKISIGSGGIYGKGILCGTQSKFNFIPENNTDFIFTTIAEENGFLGICILLLVYSILIIKIFLISIKNKNIFSKLVTASFSTILSIYIFINIGMVIGILPIVGIPLPLISYGGSSLISIMSMLGIIISINKKK